MKRVARGIHRPARDKACMRVEASLALPPPLPFSCVDPGGGAAGAAEPAPRAAGPAGAAPAEAAVAWLPPLSRIQVTGQAGSSSGQQLAWYFGPLACRCTMVRPWQLCRPRMARLIPSSSGSVTAMAAQPSRAVAGFLRWWWASTLRHCAGRSRAGGAVMPWPLAGEGPRTARRAARGQG